MTAMPVSTANEWMTELKTNKEHPYLVSVIWKVLYPAMKEANLVNDCLPDPPTPTKRAWPLGVLIMREILTKWIMASLKNTKSIPAPRILSLYCWRKYISLSSSWWKLSICEQKKKKSTFFMIIFTFVSTFVKTPHRSKEFSNFADNIKVN